MAKLSREVVERKVLGYCLDDVNLFLSTRDKITPEFFRSQAERKLYEDLVGYFDISREVLTPNIAVQMIDRETTDKVNKTKSREGVLNSISSDKRDQKEFVWYLQYLRDLYIEDLYRGMVQDIVPLIKDRKLLDVKSKVDEISFKAQEALVDKGREGRIRDTTDQVWGDYLRVEAEPLLAQGVLIGFPSFDSRTMGLQGGELMVITGDSGSGKSILSTQIGVNAFKIGKKNVVFISLEVNKQKVERRFISCYGYLPYTGIKTGKLNEADKRNLKEVVDEIKSASNDFYIIDVPRNCTTILVESKIKRVQDLFKIDLLILDYLGLMQPSRQAGTDEQNQAEVAEQIHELARAYNIPIIAPAQTTSKRNKATAKEKGTHRVARSERIAQNADIVGQIDVPDDDPSNFETLAGEDESTMFWYFCKVRDERKMTLRLKKNFARMMVVEDESPFEEEEDFE